MNAIKPPSFPNGNYTFKYDPGLSAPDIKVSVSAKDDFATINVSKGGKFVNGGSVKAGDEKYGTLSKWVGGMIQGMSTAAETAQVGAEGVRAVTAGPGLFDDKVKAEQARNDMDGGVRGGQFRMFVDRADSSAQDALIAGSLKDAISVPGNPPLKDAIANIMALVVTAKQ